MAAASTTPSSVKNPTTWSPCGSASPLSIPTFLEPWSARRSSVDTIQPGKSLLESVVTLSLMGAASLVLAALQTLVPDVVVANLALLAGLFAYQWTHVHSYKLDPRCAIIMDEAGLLSITSNFDHEQFGFVNRYQPSESTDARSRPKSLWDALFFDDRRYKIEQFYRPVYGNEYAVAQRKEAEEMEACKIRTSNASSVQPTQEMSDEQKSP